MNLSLSCSLSHRVEQRQVLSLQQRLSIEIKLFQTHEDLVNALRGNNFRPMCVCTGCGHRLSNLEIIQGFSSDVTDYMTQCPRCQTRLRAVLTTGGVAGSAEIWMYCPAQTLDQIKYRGIFEPDEWRKKHAAVYHSAIYHFGSLKKAYHEVGIKYPHVEKLEWQKQVVPFLGKLQDTQIANCAGVSTGKIRSLRESLGIPRFIKSEQIEENLN